MIYLDNASTTRVFQSTVDAMTDIYRKDFFNPSALYAPAQKCKEQINSARKIFSEILKVNENEIYFTSGATESNNWALRSGFKNKNGNFIISAGEHASIFNVATDLKSSGYELRIADLKADGTVDEKDLFSKIDDKTCLVSLIHCSNETGAINDLKNISTTIKKINPKIILHSDGVQALLKTPNSIPQLGVDLYSASAHKIGGAKGTGLLFIKNSLNLRPILLGGGQEKGLRSGTENVAGIVGFASAAKEFLKLFNKAVFSSFIDYILDKLNKEVDNFIINGDVNNSSKNILSVSFKGIKSEVLMNMMFDDGVLVGLGSACSSKNSVNRVLAAMGVSKDYMDGSIRISFSVENTMEEIEIATNMLIKNVKKLRGKIIG